MNRDTRTIAWKDGARWSAPSTVFDQLTARLDALRPVILGLDVVLARWRSATRAALDVDDFAPTEDDRAVLTAALARIVEEGAGDVEDAEARRALEEGVAALHELFVTDVTSS
jgi:hypothetical protein